MNSSLSIVIPAYQEGENILAALSRIAHHVSTPHSILIVYDGDDDNTLPPVRQAIAQGQPVQLVRNQYGAGALNAIKTGFDAATNNVIVVMMADLSDDVSKVDLMYQKMNEGYDIVCGSRYTPPGRQIGGPWFKKRLSRIAGVSLHFLAGIPTRDITNSFKMYRRSLLEEITIESTGGFELGMEIVVKAYLKGRKISEVPATWYDRQAGQSRFRLWKWLPHYLRWYFTALTGRFRRQNAHTTLIR